MRPEPFYEDEAVTIYHGDAREIVPRLGLLFDASITDPPYGETSLKWDRRVPGWPALVRPVLAPPGSLWCFGSLRMFMECATDFADWKHAQEVVWEKHNGSGFASDRFKRVHELAAHFYPSSTPWAEVYKAPQFTRDATARQVRRKTRPTHTGEIAASSYVSHDGGPRLMRSVFRARSCHGHAEHPTQKPVAVLLPLIEFSTPPGGLILDPFFGSGSTGRAAKDCGRRCVGIELSRRNCEIAVRRMAQGALALGGAA